MVNENVLIQATVNNVDHSLRNVSVSVVFNDDVDNIYIAMICSGILMNITNPSLTRDERGAILTDLNLNGKSLPADLHTHTVRGNIKYTFDFKAGKGFIFTAKNKDDI